MNGEEEARNVGFESFRDFLHSPEMATISCVENGPEGVPVYKAVPNETNAHIRAEQEKSAESQGAQIKKYASGPKKGYLCELAGFRLRQSSGCRDFILAIPWMPSATTFDSPS